MRPPTRSLTRQVLSSLLRLDAPELAARLLDPSAPAPRVRSFLHPLMGEADRVRLRLAVLGLVELRDAIGETIADDAALLALARALSREALVAALDSPGLALGFVELSYEVIDLARSPAWVHCDPAVIAATRDRAARVIADARALRERAPHQEG